MHASGVTIGVQVNTRGSPPYGIVATVRDNKQQGYHMTQAKTTTQEDTTPKLLHGTPRHTYTLDDVAYKCLESNADAVKRHTDKGVTVTYTPVNKTQADGTATEERRRYWVLADEYVKPPRKASDKEAAIITAVTSAVIDKLMSNGGMSEDEARKVVFGE